MQPLPSEPLLELFAISLESESFQATLSSPAGDEALRRLVSGACALPLPHDLEALGVVREFLVSLDALVMAAPDINHGVPLGIAALGSMEELVRELASRPRACVWAMFAYMGHVVALDWTTRASRPLQKRDLDSFHHAILHVARIAASDDVERMLGLLRDLSLEHRYSSLSDWDDKLAARRRIGRVVGAVSTWKTTAEEEEHLRATLPKLLAGVRIKSSAAAIQMASTVLERYRTTMGMELEKNLAEAPASGADWADSDWACFEEVRAGIRELAGDSWSTWHTLRYAIDDVVASAASIVDDRWPSISQTTFSSFRGFLGALHGEPRASEIVSYVSSHLHNIVVRPEAEAILAEGHGPSALARLSLAASGSEPTDPMDLNLVFDSARRAWLEGITLERKQTLLGDDFARALTALEALPRDRALDVVLALPDLYEPTCAPMLLSALVDRATREDASIAMLREQGERYQRVFTSTRAAGPVVADAVARAISEALVAPDIAVRAAVGAVMLVMEEPSATDRLLPAIPDIARAFLSAESIGLSETAALGVRAGLERAWRAILGQGEPLEPLIAKLAGSTHIPPAAQLATFLLSRDRPGLAARLEAAFQTSRQFARPALAAELVAFLVVAHETADAALVDEILDAKLEVASAIIRLASFSLHLERSRELGLLRLRGHIEDVTTYLESPGAARFEREAAILLFLMGTPSERAAFEEIFSRAAPVDPEHAKQSGSNLLISMLGAGVESVGRFCAVSENHRDRIMRLVHDTHMFGGRPHIAWEGLLHPANIEMLDTLPAHVPLAHFADFVSEKAIPSRSQVVTVLREHAQNQGIAHEYIVDGCYARAHLFADLVRKRLGQDVAIGKVFVFEAEEHPLQVSNTDYHASWWYHVAPIVYSRNAAGQVEAHVVDLSFGPELLTLHDWASHFSDPTRLGKLEITDVSQYYPLEVSAASEPFQSRLSQAWEVVAAYADAHRRGQSSSP